LSDLDEYQKYLVNYAQTQGKKMSPGPLLNARDTLIIPPDSIRTPSGLHPDPSAPIWMPLVAMAAGLISN